MALCEKPVGAHAHADPMCPREYNTQVGTARNLERRIEHLVDGLAGVMFGGTLQPSELGIRLLREADLGIEQSPSGPAVPNSYVFTLHTDQHIPEPFSQRLEHLLEETAKERGWRLNGPAGVTIEYSAKPARTEIACRAERVSGPRLAWGRLVPQSGAPYPLLYNIVLVGRSEECDVSIAVSYTHLTLPTILRV